MHELSIAQNIIDIIRQHVPETDWERIETIRLKIGSAAGIEPLSLEFSFKAITENTSLKNSRLEIDFIPFSFECNNCGKISTNEEIFSFCNECGSNNIKVISGLELNVSEIVIKEIEMEAS